MGRLAASTLRPGEGNGVPTGGLTGMSCGHTSPAR